MERNSVNINGEMIDLDFVLGADYKVIINVLCVCTCTCMCICIIMYMYMHMYTYKFKHANFN